MIGAIASHYVESGGGGGTLPAGLVVHYRVDQITGLSNGAVAPSALTDASGNGRSGTKVGSGSASAIYKTGATPQGTPSIAFGDVLAAYSFSLPTLTAVSLFMVLKRGPRAVNVGPWDLRDGDGSYYTYSDGRVYEGAFTNSGASRANFVPSVATNVFHIYHVAVGAGTLRAYINNVEQGSAAYSTFTPPTTPKVGRSTANGTDLGWDGEWAEFLAFDSVLSSADRAAVVSALTSRHL